MDPIYTDRIKTILDNKNENIQLIFIQSSQKEEMMKIFAESNISYIISVQQTNFGDDDDKLVTQFSNMFYKEYFDGKSIPQSFNNALNDISAAHLNCYVCCCAHEHDPNCDWSVNVVFEEGYETAHQIHKNYCDCKEVNF